MTILSVYIVNKAGSLLYLNECQSRLKISLNDQMRVGSTFHSVSTIAGELSPGANSSGIQLLESDTFKIYCLRPVSGIQFIVVADPQHGNLDALTKRMYEAYADFAIKNPFYTIEQPIRCELFDNAMKALLE